jgi:hypothetical protein
MRSSSYQPEAVYGFLRVCIHNPSDNPKYLPCGIFRNNTRIFPAGTYYLTITKQEYDFMVSELNLDIRIHDGMWIFVRKVSYPYRSRVMELFALKQKYKGSDEMLTDCAKKMLNSFYGKAIQMIRNNDGKLICGLGWNPMYASIITANTRIKVARVQNLLGPECLAVHTDSVMTLKPIPNVTNTLGEFSHVVDDSLILIACGMYAIGANEATKGFNTGASWRQILHHHRKKTSITLPVTKVDTWLDAVAKGNYSTINLFHKEKKIIDLNGDIKRGWLRSVTGADLLNSSEQSFHLLHLEKRPPKYWR